MGKFEKMHMTDVGVTVGASEFDFRLIFRTYPPSKKIEN